MGHLESFTSLSQESSSTLTMAYLSTLVLAPTLYKSVHTLWTSRMHCNGEWVWLSCSHGLCTVVHTGSDLQVVSLGWQLYRDTLWMCSLPDTSTRLSLESELCQ